MSKLSYIILSTLLFLLSCKKYPTESKAIIKTGVVSAITPTNAQAIGSITNITTEQITQHGHCWSSANDVPDFRINQGKSLLGTKPTDGSFQTTITSLFPSTTYYVRSFYISKADTIYGNDIKVFRTLDSIGNFPPNVSTGADSALTQTTAFIKGIIVNTGTTSVTSYGHCYSSTVTVPTIANTRTNFGATATPLTFNSNFTGLTAATTYYARAYATNSIGTSYGNVVSFTTSPIATVAPTVTTLDTMLFPNFQDTMKLRGNLLNSGSSNLTELGHLFTESITNATLTTANTTKYFSNLSSTPGQFSTSIPFGATNPLTKYRFRSFATNSAGTSYGAEYYDITGFKGISTAFNYTTPVGPNTTGGVSVSYNGLMYFGLGDYSNSGPGVDTFGYWRTFDPATGAYASKTRCPLNFVGATAFLYNNKIYVVGGRPNNFTFLANSYIMEYNPATNTWAAALTFNVQTFWNGIGFLIGSKYYFGLGTVGNNPANALQIQSNVKKMYVYDLVANTVTPLPDVPFTGRSGAYSFALSNLGYVVGGTAGNISNAFVENTETWQFNPVGNVWTQKANHPIVASFGFTGYAFGNADAFENNGYIWAGKAITPNVHNTNVLRYDPIKNNWREVFSGPITPYTFGYGAMVNRTLIYGGGITFDAPTVGLTTLK